MFKSDWLSTNVWWHLMVEKPHDNQSSYFLGLDPKRSVHWVNALPHTDLSKESDQIGFSGLLDLSDKNGKET